MSIRDFFKKRVGVSRNIFALGIVSFFNDIASEMLYPVVPIFLTSILGAPVAIVGLIEGIAESTASILKVVSGWFSDRFRSRKPFMVSGYSCSALSKILLGLAYGWPLVLIARFIDRFGKGIRTSARDALIVESTKGGTGPGRSFGFHRGLDTAGAALGPLFTIILLRHFQDNLRPIFFLALIPAFLGILFLLFFGIVSQSFFLWLLFPVYGVYMAFTEGIGKAHIAGLVPPEKAGTAFGFYQTVIGLCTFFASLIAGLLWTYVSPQAPFIFGSVMALIACFIFMIWGRRKC